MFKYLKSFIITLLLTITAPSAARERSVDLVVVNKSLRTLDLVNINFLGRQRVIKSYKIMLGKDPIGHKVQEGDNKTPEGRYTIDWKNPGSAFHLSLHINYPNEEDRAYAQALGVSPGGEIFIHGMPNNIAPYRFMFPHLSGDTLKERVYLFLSNFDWTAGCIAVSNQEIEEIYRMVKPGTPIEIYP